MPDTDPGLDASDRPKRPAPDPRWLLSPHVRRIVAHRYFSLTGEDPGCRLPGWVQVGLGELGAPTVEDVWTTYQADLIAEARAAGFAPFPRDAPDTDRRGVRAVAGGLPSAARLLSPWQSPLCVPRPADSTDETTALLRALVAEIRGLRADLQGRRTAPMLSRNDRQALEKPLPAIVGALGSEPFTSRDLPDAAGVRVVVRGLSVKQIGRLLSRAEGVPIGGLVVERCGVEINVALWHALASVSNRLATGTGLAQSGSIAAGEEPDVR